MYTIGETAKMLGLTTDTIRFYVEKGLVHPEKNPANRYLLFSFENLLELTNVVYYRCLDFSIAEIQDIMHSRGSSEVVKLISEKSREVEHRIRYQQQLLKKINYVRSIHNTVNEYAECRVTTFPESYVLFISCDRAPITYQLKQLTPEQIILCGSYDVYELNGQKLSQGKSYGLLRKSAADAMHMRLDSSLEVIRAYPCVRRMFHIRRWDISLEELMPIRMFADKLRLNYGPTFLVRKFTLTSYQDTDNLYADIYLPIGEGLELP
ncbi:helix-turn-helix domain-containing protein [Gehongia tenuis]|uniref:MerR family transcriptional regulator n=1 Tax=Gehongia tenuis TaxID=2763655 RepID=A0A926HK80_9FIRM|nr:MerR family transcriptional regulator [Gehongia tenuis]MBC8530687.1 MerR family transcriptional regulator [Gehongia tenuis]